MRPCRGARIDNREWVKGWLIASGNQCFIVNCQWPVEWVDGHTINMKCFEQVLPESVGQSTGLKDKDGAEIWEGDIVEIDSNCFAVSHGDHMNPVAVVELGLRTWLKTEQFGYEGETLVEPFQTKIIGNTTDNPKLLETK